MVSHRNVISEILLLKQFESHTRTAGQKDVVLGLLPYSHIFGLSVFTAAVFRGETVVVLPKFELNTLLDAIQRTGINNLYLVSLWICGIYLSTGRSEKMWTDCEDGCSRSHPLSLPC